jgi:D-inositol-3-phosphate glycosyltransferase
MHTSPLAQPGLGDGGGLNVYVHQLCSALARSGVACDVYTRADSPDVPAVVGVEPGLRVHHVAAGPLAAVPKEQLESLVPEFADAVMTRMGRGYPPDALHANYWLSGVAAHQIKHALDVPLGCTFHTLARVKAVSSGSPGGADAESPRRAQAEAEVIGCSEAIFASCTDEAEQLLHHYDADPERLVILSPGVDHAYFAPGAKAGARRAIGVDADTPVLLFVGRIQPLKGADVAVEAFAALAGAYTRAPLLVVVGGPSGPEGAAHLARVHELVRRHGLGDSVRFVDPQPHELLSSYYRAASVVLVPSRSESFGLVALEAAACGTPVVASAVGGLQTLIDHGRTGFLVEGRRPEDFAAAAAPILADPDFGLSMGRAAAERARRYRWSASAARLRAVFGELTDRVLIECP